MCDNSFIMSSSYGIGDRHYGEGIGIYRWVSVKVGRKTCSIPGHRDRLLFLSNDDKITAKPLQVEFLTFKRETLTAVVRLVEIDSLIRKENALVN